MSHDKNIYAYVRGNPVSMMDPTGLTSLSFSCSANTLTVNPEVKGRSSYTLKATSGREGSSSCKNRSEKNSGALPNGKYSINSKDVSNPGTLGDIARNARGDWGDWRSVLNPEAGTDTYGRSGFFLHGGSIPGSAGCIDFGGGMFGNAQTTQLLNDILNDPDGKFQLRFSDEDESS